MIDSQSLEEDHASRLKAAQTETGEHGEAQSVMKQPRVAVVMTVYNGMPYLPEAVESILNQTYRDFEFLIINDGSTDGTADYLQSLRDARVRLFSQVRQGQQAAAHLGITSTQATYIARMDSDDVASPTRLEKQVAYLDQHPDVGLVGTQITRRGESGSGLMSILPTEHDQIVDDLMHNRHSMCNPSTMLRRELYFTVGGYWEHNIAEDWDLFLRLAEISKLANLDEPLLSYRFHTGSINGRRIVEAQLYNEYAAHLARLRATQQPHETYPQFLAQHRSRRFPSSVFFHLDCYSLAQYRRAVADLHSGRPLRGYVRMAYAIACSPKRLLRRMRYFLAAKFKPKASAASAALATTNRK